MTIYMVTHKMRWLGQEIRNVFYYETTVGDPSTSEWGDIADEIRADISGALDQRMSTSWTWYALDYRIVDTAGLLSFEAIPAAGDIDGAKAEDDLPTQIALLVSVKGATTKPNRARTYMAGFTEVAVLDSLFLAGPIGEAETFIDLQSALNSGGTNPLQRVAAQWNTGHTAVTVTNNIAGSASVGSLVPATQRRRRIGVGI